MRIYKLTELNKDTMQQVDSLLHTLNTSAKPLNQDRLNQLIAEKRLHIFICQEQDDGIIGMLTLTTAPTLSQDKLWIEDVIVGEAYRGKGIGRALIQEAKAFAETITPEGTLYLTSNPSRTAARKLYMSEGFEQYETGVFLYKFGRN